MRTDSGLRIGPWRLPGPTILWILALAAVVFAAGIGLRDPWPPDEPRFALIARDMVWTGQWFFPHVAGVLYPDKPPLFFWCIAAFYWLTGSLRVAFLLPTLLAALGCVWLVYDLGRRLWTRGVGLWAALALLATLQFALQAKLAQIDMLLTFWVTLGMYGLLRHTLKGPDWRWYGGAGVAMGLGILSKGVGFLPLLGAIPWGWARARGWNGLTPDTRWRWQWVLAPLAIILVVCAWLLPMLWLVAAHHDPSYAAYRDNILFHQTADRYAHTWVHQAPWWYFIVMVIPVFWLPLTALLPWLAPAWWRRLKRGDARYLILLGWIVLFVTFFSFSPGKRGVYLLPCTPMLALAAAPLLPGLVRKRGAQLLGFVMTLLIAALWFGLLAWFLWLNPEKGADLVARYEVTPWGFFTGLGIMALLALLPGPRRGLYGLCGYFMALWIAFGVWGYPLFNPIRSPANFMHEVSQRVGPQGKIALVGWKEQFVLQADRPVEHFGYRRGGSKAELHDAIRWLAAGKDRWLLLSTDAADNCIDPDQVVHLGYRHQEHWWLVNQKALTDGCLRKARAQGPPADRVETELPPEDEEPK